MAKVVGIEALKQWILRSYDNEVLVVAVELADEDVEEAVGR